MHLITIYSGGLDSTTLLFWLQHEGHTVTALSIDYGQRHRQELLAAQAFCLQQQIPWHCADLSALRPFLKGSSQTDDTVTVPHGHYMAETMKQTVVPNRNMLLLAVGIATAISQHADGVAYAAHSGDHAIYPDCRPVFVEAMTMAAGLCDWHPVKILAPFLSWTKADIVCEGARLDVPFALTWSCYDPQEKYGTVIHCGLCGTCVERREAFVLAGVSDPTEYLHEMDTLKTLHI